MKTFLEVRSEYIKSQHLDLIEEIKEIMVQSPLFNRYEFHLSDSSSISISGDTYIVQLPKKHWFNFVTFTKLCQVDPFFEGLSLFKAEAADDFVFIVA